MKNLLRFLLMLTSFALFSCDKEDDLSITDDVYTPPVIAIKGSIAGLVVNEIGSPIVGAMVRVGSEQKETGPGGYFIFKNITLDANGTFIKVDQPGYFHASRRFYPKVNAMNYTTLTLMFKSNTGQVNATTGGTVNVPGGATVELPANGVAKTDGTLYTGEVRVAARWLNPTAENLTEIMPGNLQGINDRREEVALATYGMMAVELTGTDGSPLNLASGSKAELSIPIPSQLQGSAPNEIPLWHFDETTGLWREEGFAVRQGNAYVGEVSHFSFWNCDVPYPLVNIEGTILTPDGNPLINVWVRVTVAMVGSGYGTVDDNGYFNGAVPAGQTLLLEAIDPCYQVLLSQSIGPFTSDTDLGNFTAISGSTFKYTNVTGSLVNCNNEPMVNGIFRICQDGNCNFVATDGNGNLNTSMTYCSSGDIRITAYDLDAQLQSTAQNYAAAPIINVGTLAACATQISEFIRMNINGEEVVYPLPYEYGQPGSIRHVAAFAPDSSYTFSLAFPVGAPGSYTGEGVVFYSEQISPTYLYGLCEWCQDLTVTVTEFGNIGEFIRGTFSGNLDFYDINQQLFPNLPVSGQFAVIRLQ